MAEVRPVTVKLEWNGDLKFTGRAGQQVVPIDGSATSAVTPVQMLALALASCMAVDLVHILARGRHPLTSLSAEIRAERAPAEPKRFTRVYLDYTVAGDVLPEHVERAIDLSREKYCSVWSTLRQDIELIVAYTITGK